MPFVIHALDAAPFAPLFALSDAALAARGARRVIADESPGFPCRISLAEAEIGETLILTNYQHLDIPSPYRASHAIYVREGAQKAELAPNVTPDILTRRRLSVRGFDAEGYLQRGEVIEGADLAPMLEAFFADQKIAFTDIHNAGHGCFAARARRA